MEDVASGASTVLDDGYEKLVDVFGDAVFKAKHDKIVNASNFQPSVVTGYTADLGKEDPRCKGNCPFGPPTPSPDTPCLNDCSGRGTCSLGVCACQNGYTGEACEIEPCPASCNGPSHGTCRFGTCICMVSFYGEACEKLRCPLDCSGRGRCEEGRCLCHKGYEGDGCEATMAPRPIAPTALNLPPSLGTPVAQPLEAECPANCNGRGRCQEGLCFCFDRWSGDACQDYCPGSCGGRGACNGGRCLCLVGYSGDDCSQSDCCSGHGDCPLPGECRCHPGWSGDQCSEQAAPGPAPMPSSAAPPAASPAMAPAPAAALVSRGATVAAAKAPAAVQHCADWDEELGLPDCSGRGRCVAGQCECPPGWGQALGGSGPNTCAVRVCLADCGDHGACSDGRCVCHAGWSGERCSKKQAAALVARRGGPPARGEAPNATAEEDASSEAAPQRSAVILGLRAPLVG